MRHGIGQHDCVVDHSVFASNAEPQQQVESTPADEGTTSLRRVLPDCRFFAGDDVHYVNVAQSAETATEGSLVVYRIGLDCPVKLVADAMARGAAGIVTEQILPCPLPQCIVGDIEIAIARITAEELGRPDRKLLTVGVIGSAGKTTTTLLISSLLRSSGIRTAYQSDLGDSDGVVQGASGEGVPAGSRLVEWIGEANDSECRAAIMELSDDQARHGYYDSVEFDMVVVTGSATCSGDFGPSGLQCVLERLADGGVVIAPVDDVKATRIIRDCGAKLLTYSVHKAADVSVKIIDEGGGVTTLLVSHGDATAAMETHLCGAAMAANHAAAIAFGLLIGEPLERIVEKLSQLRSIPGRTQRLEQYSHAAVVLDAGGTPERAATTLRTCRSMKGAGRLWCVLAINGGDDPETLARYGTLTERFADHTIVTSQAGKKSSFLGATHNVLDGVNKCAAFRMVADRRRAIEWAVSEARPDDTILVIAGERHDNAVSQRSDIERLGAWVETARNSQDRQDPGESPKLKIFG